MYQYMIYKFDGYYGTYGNVLLHNQKYSEIEIKKIVFEIMAKFDVFIIRDIEEIMIKEYGFLHIKPLEVRIGNKPE